MISMGAHITVFKLNYLEFYVILMKWPSRCTIGFL